MSVSVRLKRMGRNNKPFYRIVVADTLKKREGAYLENLGWYDPNLSGVNFKLDRERIEYWDAKGARISDTVRSLVKKQRRIDRAGGSSTQAAEPEGVAVEEASAT